MKTTTTVYKSTNLSRYWGYFKSKGYEYQHSDEMTGSEWIMKTTYTKGDKRFEVIFIKKCQVYCAKKSTCKCKKPQFTRTVDAEFNPLCGSCGLPI